MDNTHLFIVFRVEDSCDEFPLFVGEHLQMMMMTWRLYNKMMVMVP